MRLILAFCLITGAKREISFIIQVLENRTASLAGHVARMGGEKCLQVLAGGGVMERDAC